MPTLDRTSTTSSSSASAFGGGFAGALKALADEASVLVQALLSPNKIIEEVEEMRALHARADRIESSDPARAEVLRWHASRVGLR